MMDARPLLVQMDSWTVAVCHQHFARNSTPLSTTWFPSESCSLDDIIIYPPRSISEVIDSSSASHQFSLMTLYVGEPSTTGFPAHYNMSLDNIHECRPMTVNASAITERSLENPHDSSRMLTTRSRSSLRMKGSGSKTAMIFHVDEIKHLCDDIRRWKKRSSCCSRSKQSISTDSSKSHNGARRKRSPADDVPSNKDFNASGQRGTSLIKK